MRRLTTIYLTLLAACLLCFDTRGGLSASLFTAPLLLSLLLSLSTWLPQRWGKAVSITAVELLLVVAVADVYCSIRFKSPICPHIYQLVALTDGRETSEFFAQYVSLDNFKNPKMLGLLALMVVYPVLTILPQKLLDRVPLPGRLNPWCLLLLPLLVLPELRFMRVCSNADVQGAEQFVFQREYDVESTPWHRLTFSALATWQSERQMATCKRNTYAATVEHCDRTSPHIVLIIGESANKYHSSLYGYKLPTTPNQQRRADNGELTVFTNAISPWNITSNFFQSFFAQPSPAGEVYFPILFRRGGYHVRFLSNQFPEGEASPLSLSEASRFFLLDTELSDSLFDYRNKRRCPFDGEFVSEECQRDSIDVPAFDIIHLMGQHFSYYKRYPHNEAAFVSFHPAYKNIAPRNRAVAAQYDNATFYNDKVLEMILQMYENEDAVVVYLSDHSEEVFDAGDFQGRVFGEMTEANRKYQLEVPMWVWTSTRYRQNHPELVRRMNALKDKPVMTDTIPQMLLDLAGINNSWRGNDRNPFNRTSL